MEKILNKTFLSFDRFIEEFSSKNLEGRVKLVSYIVLLLLLIIGLLGTYLLTRNLEISMEGRAVLSEDSTLPVYLEERFIQYMTDNMPLFLFLSSGEQIRIPYEVVSQERVSNGLILTLRFHHHSLINGMRGTINYKIILRSKRYIDFLMGSESFL